VLSLWQRNAENTITKVKWKKANPEIQDELQDHILCQKNAFVAEGIDESLAIDLATAQTGEAAVIGKKLNRANRSAENRASPFINMPLWKRRLW